MPKPSQLNVTAAPVGSEWMIVVKDGVTSKVALSVLKQHVTDYWITQQVIASIASDPPTANMQEGSADQADLYSNYHAVAQYQAVTVRSLSWMNTNYPTQTGVFLTRARTVIRTRLNAALAAVIPSNQAYTAAQINTILGTGHSGTLTIGDWTLNVVYQEHTYGHTDSLGWHGGFRVTVTVASYNG